ncbi:MAG: hypothetical protein JO066_11610 [Verrucomicrobia bacterium]|nr:hypothetical protein [Verrucomicrobiota bacterium]
MPFLPANAHADAKTRIGRAAVQLTATAGLSTTVLEETSMVARMITSWPPYPRHRGRLEARLQGLCPDRTAERGRHLGDRCLARRGALQDPERSERRGARSAHLIRKAPESKLVLVYGTVGNAGSEKHLRYNLS